MMWALAWAWFSGALIWFLACWFMWADARRELRNDIHRWGSGYMNRQEVYRKDAERWRRLALRSPAWPLDVFLALRRSLTELARGHDDERTRT